MDAVLLQTHAQATVGKMLLMEEPIGTVKSYSLRPVCGLTNA